MRIPVRPCPTRPFRGTVSRQEGAAFGDSYKIGPPTDGVDRALDRLVTSTTDPCFQYSSRPWCCSQISKNGGRGLGAPTTLPASRRPRHRSGQAHELKKKSPIQVRR